MERIAITLLTLALALLAIPALAADRVAPLPEGFAPSDQAKVRGLYAEAGFGSLSLNVQLETLETACNDRGVTPKVTGRELQWKGLRRIYRSATSIAVIEDRPTIAVDSEACSAAISLVRSVEAKSGSWPAIRTYDWIDEHPKCGRFVPKCTNETVAGVKARCVNLGDGLVGSSVCYSIQDDLSEDLVLARSSYTDDGSGPDSSWTIDVVMADALIDPAVFGGAK